MSFDFTDKHVVVCGGSRGIGRAIAIGFAKAGAKVSICARGKEALEKTKAELGKGAHAATCDLSNKKAVEGYIAKAAKALGSIDVLINNASGFGMTDSEEDWEKSLSVDVLATVRASKAALAHFPKKGGAIVNISSISGFRASGRGPSYAAVKALLFNYTQSQALALAPKGIRVNCIAPGSIEFPGGSWEARKKSDPKLYKAILDSIPYGRLGYPEEVADVALFFASPAARWVTGQTISVDGGQLLTG